jgi:MFS transporter, DHA1 family, inner membrane transport protein
MVTEPISADTTGPIQDEEKIARRLIIAVVAITFGRLAINVTRRFAYPFVGTIAGQLHVPVGAIQSVLALQGATGLSSIIFGPFSETYGRKRVMAAVLALMTVSAITVVIWPNFWLFALVMLVFGACKYTYDPAMQAFIGDNIPYNRRGLAIGTVELSWAVSLMIASPVVAMLLATSQAPRQHMALLETISYLPIDVLSESGGIRLTFMMMAALVGLSVIIIWRLVPSDVPSREISSRRRTSPIDTFRIIWKHPAALAAVIYAFALNAANEVFLINYGLWMEASFGLLLAAIGVATIVIAVAEVAGEFVVIGLADRLGKRRMALWGAIIASLSYVAVPLFAPDLTWALIGLFIMFICQEAGVVAAIPLYTEILPGMRAVLLSGTVASGAVGRLIGAAIGGLLLSISGDFIFIGAVATSIGLFAAYILLRHISTD